MRDIQHCPDECLSRALRGDDAPRLPPVIWQGKIVEWESLSMTDLEVLLAEAKDVLARRQARQCDGLQRDIANLAKAAGLTPAEWQVLMG